MVPPRPYLLVKTTIRIIRSYDPQLGIPAPGNDLCPSLKKVKYAFRCSHSADKQNGRLPHPFFLGRVKSLEIYSP
jgi:hypothetical protein